MLSTNIAAYTTAWQLLKSYMAGFSKTFIQKMIDATINLASTVLVFAYFMPQQTETPGGFGQFILVGMLINLGFFEIVGKLSDLSNDLEGPKTISYRLLLPMPSWLAFSSLAIEWTCMGAIIVLFSIPLGFLLMSSQLTLANISIFKTIIMFIVSHCFFGFFALWLASMLKGVDFGMLWTRILGPLFSFGGFWFSWYTLYRVTPTFGYLNLLNPLIYVMDGTRAAVLGQTGYLPFWLCVGMLILFTVFCGWHAVYRLKKRLDCL